ncbi:ADP-ribose glycohydrolase OARD1-like [Aethina tumida]|uniref:ADP-ribose glycohydrolase OARD1-like n=1 Tax=Aethina tumida TaxID=116153 RepID=UPI0021490106|nr:ADP-ribose glycohydrolase OARD1-like [Aethina tumida]
MSKGIAYTFKKRFGQVEKLRKQGGSVKDVLYLRSKSENEHTRNFFYLLTKHSSHDKPTYQRVWKCLIKLKNILLAKKITQIAIPKLACSLDGLDWKTVRNMLKTVFENSGNEILLSC